MKVYLTFFLVLLVSNVSLFGQTKSKTISSKIEKVIVFTEGAQVVRTAKATFSSGKTELVFSGVSPKIDKESLQVKGKGAFTIQSVVHQNNHLTIQKNREEIEKLQSAKLQLNKKRTFENNVLTILKNEESILAKNQVIGGTNSGLKMTDLREAVDFQRQRLIDLLKQKSDVEAKMSSIDSTITKLDKQLKSLNESNETATSDIVVTVSSRGEIANASFEITYYVMQAGWYSNYDLRVEDIKNPIELLFKANIFQSSGEDWNDVSLTISNGNPTESGVAPTLQPWYLNLNQRIKPSGSVQAYGQLIGNTITGVVSEGGIPLPGANVIVKGTSIGTSTDFDGKYSIKVPNQNSVLEFSFVGMKSQLVNANSKVINVSLDSDTRLEEVVVVSGYNSSKKKQVQYEEESIALQTAVNYQPTTITYEINEPYTILSDNKKYTAEIKRFELPAQYQYYAVPKLDESVYLTAKVTNWQELNLFDGELNLFFEGAYLGKSLLDLQSASDTLDISLGKDKGIVILRKKLKEFSSKQFLSNYKKESRAYDIIVKNNKPYAVNITVLDQLPISNNKEIILEEQFYNEGEIDKNTNIVKWNLTIPSKTERKVQLKYQVKYPKNEFLQLE
ncbi:mucoidy inhibitor MuiA family protein [Flavobacterium filum]|uniref:mucoidy inhibitor MuiA family protein n=1 Tax=Flavobacterium filum TaxID=370974 RepID=UPI00041E554A|nr:mucoidy inhibitor MuiA family protein [Flavobacterium filum]